MLSVAVNASVCTISIPITNFKRFGFIFHSVFRQIFKKSFISYSNISRSKIKCLARLVRREQGISLKNFVRCSEELPPLVWRIMFDKSWNETFLLNPDCTKTYSSSSFDSNFTTASYGTRQGAHCRLKRDENSYLNYTNKGI